MGVPLAAATWVWGIALIVAADYGHHTWQTSPNPAGVPLGDLELLGLAKDLKRLCGSGGTLKNGIIEVQGDHVEKIMGHLQGRGYKVKRSGG